MLLLANVIYFKSTWENQFSPRRTHVAPFNVSSRESTLVNMMVATESFPYGNLDQLDSKVVVLPYRVKAVGFVTKFATGICQKLA